MKAYKIATGVDYNHNYYIYNYKRFKSLIFVHVLNARDLISSSTLLFIVFFRLCSDNDDVQMKI